MKEIDASDYIEYNGHKLVVKIEDKQSGLLGFIAIHRQNHDFPSLGATRMWNYAKEEDALRDALRLSELMSMKSLLAGLPYGGAKAVLMSTDKAKKNREEVFRAYGMEVERLKGKFITGTDVGLTNEDLDSIRKETDYVIGQGVDSGYFTAIGVMHGIEAVLEKIYGKVDLTQSSFAIQGLGNTGFQLLSLLAEAGVKNIVVSEINNKLIEKATSQFPWIQVVDSKQIHKQKVDILAPCALAHTLNKFTVSDLKCKAIVGSANNQLSEERLVDEIHNLGILYAPDFIVNAGGIISVVDQFEHDTHDVGRIKEKIKHIRDRIATVISN